MPMFDGLNCDCFVMELQLRHLVDSALLEDVEMSSGEVSIHDLYREFAELEAQGKLMALDMEERRWVYARGALPTEMEDEPKSSWKKLTRVCIAGTDENMDRSSITSVRTIEWKYCTNLVVLKLVKLYALSGILNFKDLIRLRSLTVKTKLGRSPSKFSIEGLEGLKFLTYFKMYFDRGFGGYGESEAYVGQLPAALKVLEVDAPVVFERDFLALCTNLVSLKLREVNTTDLDLRSCASLQNVELANIQPLERSASKLSIEGLEGLKTLTYFKMVCVRGDREAYVGQLPAALKVLQVEAAVVFERDFLALCTNLVSLKLSDVNTADLNLRSCTSLQDVELIDIERLKIVRLGPSLQSLYIYCCSELVEVCGLDRLVGLLSLVLNWNQKLSKLPNLSGLEQLEVIDASENSQLTSLQGLGDLRALTILKLSSCESLCRLSNMSKLTNVKVLDLSSSGVEFHEEDIHTLEGLQALEPVLAAYDYGLDFKRHKIMTHFGLFWDYQGWQTWKECEWEEKDLHYPSVDGYLVGKGFGIRDVETIWRLIPGPTTKFVGTERHLVW